MNKNLKMKAKNYLKTFISFSFLSGLLFGKANANIQLHNTYFKRCLNNLNQEKYELALEDCNKAIKAHSKWGNTFNNRGLVHQQLGNFESAIADFKPAMKLSPAIVSAKNYGNLAYAYESLGNFQGAIENYTKAISIAPDQEEVEKIELDQDVDLVTPADLYMARGNVYSWMNNKYKKACNDWKVSKKLGDKEAQKSYRESRC